jgi:hypothetical protein
MPRHAKHNPVTTQYAQQGHSEDIPLTQKNDIELPELGQQIVHGEALASVGDAVKNPYLEALAFNEEPITILIEENSRSDFPETHVPVAVNGKNAEVFVNGRWMEMGWLPIGQPIITKRKYVENLLRSKSDAVRTEHDDATMERPRNTVKRRPSANYPVSVLEDKNPRGGQWLTKVRMEH